MSIKQRLSHLEGHQDPDESCPECHDRARMCEVYNDGTQVWISGGPCSLCDREGEEPLGEPKRSNRVRPISLIEVMMCDRPPSRCP
jgi:hypothetical protein